MDRLKLSRIDEELESSEVAALCFLCRDVVNRKRLEGLLQTIRREDLLNLLETDSRTPEETDARPSLSAYRVMLYNVYEDMTQENLEKMKFLLTSKLGKRQIETSDTALDLFAEMEKTSLLSNTNVYELLKILREFDQQLALIVQRYRNRETLQGQRRSPHHVSMDYQRVNSSSQPPRPSILISETQPSYEEGSVYADAEPNSLLDETEEYTLKHIPRGFCVVLNNEVFLGQELRNRGGTQEDARALDSVFTSLGFTVVVHNNLSADAMRQTLKELGKKNFLNHDALVVCVLSHGEKGCVFGSDEQQVLLRELTEPFTSKRAPTLAGKPKLFFIQACQGGGYQGGSIPCPPMPKQEEGVGQSHLEEDAGRLHAETVPWDADFLLGMATVPEYKSFRNTSTGSIYIQELCRQLKKSAESSMKDDILTVLTRVNREVSKGEYRNYKQMPEPKYTLTKKLVLKFV
ncbi:caspase-8 isoform X2 [Xiphias gladius]|uniref:caspase-8 isoform X2 n=1 Tax=Xiphias gladius TaxID=8245 RepID=UPI001A982FDA|nr:caspase-8 isoform X2 [Xiphias gladius]